MKPVEKLESRLDNRVYLPATGSWPNAYHLFQKRPARALIAALSAGRPLLVRGEPGVGKSQLARAAAAVLEWPFISTVIQPNTEYQELLWVFDHTQRLGDAQLAGAIGTNGLVKDTDQYVSPGPLWYALNWVDAAKDGRNRQNYRPPADVDPPTEEQGVVLLIDEIDKADISVANGLLEVLGNGRFDVQTTGETVCAGGKPPLVVLTSNDTRELPAAMVRRCVVLDIKLPDSGDELIRHLMDIGRAHFADVDEAICREAAEDIVADRERCHELPRTGQAEYLDLLRALNEVAKGDANGQRSWLHKLRRYFQKSHAHR